jgi:hypothetical protein
MNVGRGLWRRRLSLRPRPGLLGGSGAAVVVQTHHISLLHADAAGQHPVQFGRAVVGAQPGPLVG